MSDMEQIETSIRRHDFFPGRAQIFYARLKLFQWNNFVVDHRFTTKFSARGRIWNTAGALPTSSPSTLKHIPGRDRTEIFLARRNIVALLERCFPKTISAASNAISAAQSFGIKTSSSKPSLGL